VRPARVFTSWLAPYFRRFVALKRAAGSGYYSQKGLLLAFDRHLRDHAPRPPLRRETILAYLTSLADLFARSRDNMIAVVWPALEYSLRHGARIESIPLRPPRAPIRLTRRPPQLISPPDFQRVLQAAQALPPERSIRAATAATLLALLYATGIRIGEALALTVADLDRHDRTLMVKRGKFGKARLLPLRVSVVDALEKYLAHPRRGLGRAASAPLFVSWCRSRLSHTAAYWMLRDAWERGGLHGPKPRLHDLRHSFAVLRLQEWYARRLDVNSLLPVLSTYLGHVSVENTRLYLVANAVLLEEASGKFDRWTTRLDEAWS
jgi:integrase